MIDTIDILGRMGEKIVANKLREQGRMVTEAIDHFDREKDMMVDGALVEIKTQQPFFVQNAFSFRSNQLRKCSSVDELYFVSVPPVIKPDYKWGGWIFKVDPKNFTTRSYRTKGGIDMVLVDIEQPAVVPFLKMSEQEIAELVKYAKSAYSER